MSNPQCENGYTKIANEILDALCHIRINGEARQILDTIIRKTYGYHKKQDKISLSQFVITTGIKKPNICKAINKLRQMNLIIIIQKDNGDINSYRFNKDFDTWEPLSKKITLSKKIISVIQKDNASLSKKIHTKDNTTKDNKDIPPSAVPINSWTKEILIWLEERRKTKFADYGKQLSALGRLKKAGYAPEDIKKYLALMEKDDWWKDKSPDFVNLAGNIHKYNKKEDLNPLFYGHSKRN